MIEGVSQLFGWDCGCEVSGEGGIEERVSIGGNVLQQFSSCGSGSERSLASQGRSFSWLRFVGLAGLFIGTRGQKTDPFPAVIDLANLDPSDGFVIEGVMSGDNVGRTVSNAGDLNVDGVDDFAFTSLTTKEISVIFGNSKLGKTKSVNLTNVDGSNGIKIISGNVYSIFGGSDINFDNKPDLIIGSPFPKGSSRIAYVVFGSSAIGGDGIITTSTLNGTNGFKISGKLSNNLSGHSASSGEDVNGDGIDDLILGDSHANPGSKDTAGQAFVIFGGGDLGNTGAFDLLSLNGANGFKINGEAVGDRLGSSVSMPGDVNGDGVDDLIVAASSADTINGINTGASYVIFGKSNWVNNGTFDLNGLNGVNGFVIHGKGSYEYVTCRTGIGDFNVDGINDFILINNRKNTAYIIYGKKNIGMSGQFELNLDGMNGFVILFDGSRDENGNVASGGDINGDGNVDIVLALPKADLSNRTDTGRIYVVYGGLGIGKNVPVNIASINSTYGFVIIGEHAGDQAGASVSFAGDVNNDGVDDLLIGAPYADPNNVTDAGRVYVIFGRKVGHTARETKTRMGTTQVTAMNKDTGFQVAKTSSKESTITTDIVLPPSTDAPRSSGLVIGVGVGVTAFVCSLVAGGLFYLRKKSASHTSSRLSDQEDPQAGYVSIDSALSGMQSARAENGQNSNYDIIPTMSPNNDYNDWPSKPAEHTLENYDKVGLDTLNRDMDEYNAVKFKDAQEEYDDIAV